MPYSSRSSCLVTGAKYENPRKKGSWKLKIPNVGTLGESLTKQQLLALSGPKKPDYYK